MTLVTPASALCRSALPAKRTPVEFTTVMFTAQARSRRGLAENWK